MTCMHLLIQQRDQSSLSYLYIKQMKSTQQTMTYIPTVITQAQYSYVFVLRDVIHLLLYL
jgi:hypothetical protein